MAASTHLGLRFRGWGAAGLQSSPGEVLLIPLPNPEVRGKSSVVCCVVLEIAVRRIWGCLGNDIGCFVIVAAYGGVGLDLWRRCRFW